MKYNFDQTHSRRNTDSLKWDVTDRELPMWVADMDFETAPEIRKAVMERASKGIYGYNIVPDEWYTAIQGWWKRRHGYWMEQEWMTFCTGVVPAVTSSVKRLTNIGDSVVVQTPVYDIFFHSIENTGRHVLENELAYDGYEYQINYADLEEKLSRPTTTMMILCNPHNPAGRIWKKEELLQIGMLCKKHHVVVLSDEIHCDITDPGTAYTPFAAVSEDCKNISITCVSATKAFNIAGLQTAAVIIPDQRLREIVVRGLNSDELAEPNTFATTAVIAAFNQGEQWLDELNTYLYQNKQYAAEFIAKELPALKHTNSTATYLLWLDCSGLTERASEFGTFLRERTGLYLSDGAQYRGNGASFLRMNLACPRETLQEGLKRLKEGVLAFEQHK